MIVYGFDSIESLLEQEAFLFKLLANDSVWYSFDTQPSIVTRRNLALNTPTILTATRLLRW